MSTSFTNLQAVPIDGALPPQNTTTAGKALVSNGTNAGWNTVLSMIGSGAGQTTGATLANAILPAQTGMSGYVLSTDGNGTLSWTAQASGGGSGVSSVTISGTTYTGAVTITNVPSATTATNVSGVVAIANGGTGATSTANALTNLGAAPLASPSFAGTPTAPTASVGTNTQQIATTAFVTAAIPTNLNQLTNGPGYQTAAQVTSLITSTSPSAILGARSARTAGTTYTAATDGILTGTNTVSGASSASLNVYINGSVVSWASGSTPAGGSIGSVQSYTSTVAIRKNETYYMFGSGFGTTTITWTPIGS